MGSGGQGEREEGAESAELLEFGTPWSFGRIRSGEELELQLGVGRAYGRRSGWLHASQPSVSMDRDLPTVGACRSGAVETVPSDLCI